MSYRGKKRRVVEVLGQSRAQGESNRFYVYRVKLECGHVVIASAGNRYKKASPPVLGYCTQCAALDMEAA